MTTPKNEIFIGLQHENYYLVGGDKNLVGRGVYYGGGGGGGGFPGGGEANFRLAGGNHVNH